MRLHNNETDHKYEHEKQALFRVQRAAVTETDVIIQLNILIKDVLANIW